MLGFFLGFGIGGFTNEGDTGAEVCWGSPNPGSFSANPFAFLGLRGLGEVMGRSYVTVPKDCSTGWSDIVRSSRECIPKVVPEKDDRGIIVTGDSGDELGDGSVNEEESAVDIVVVGEESVDSEAFVEALSRC
jgi:hypothetical protein